MAGTGQHKLLRAAKSMYKNDQDFKDAVIHGGMGADLLSNDIRRFGVGNDNMFFRKFSNMQDNKNPILTVGDGLTRACLLYTSPSPRDGLLSRMPSSA